MKWDRTAARRRNVEDRRTGGNPRGGAVAGGVGGISIIGLILYLLFGIGNGGIPDTGGLGQAPAVESSVDDAVMNERADFVDVVQDDVQRFWDLTFTEYGLDYSDATLVLFDTPINTACGGATAAIGPHYCSLNNTMYIELGFLDVMEQQLGARGDFAFAYVIAHEVAHHVQNELGISGWVREESAKNPRMRNELSIRLELQADCLSGVWAQTLGDNREGESIWAIDETDIREAIDAAAAVGDDRIQEQSTGRINKESWTHGSSEQRMEWFLQGFRTGDTEACETFDGL